MVRPSPPRAAAFLSLATAAATVVLFLVSRGKWSDAIIDSGREWIVPDALARGELLYRDVVYWFGPLTPYFHASVFRFFESSLRSLVLAGAIGSAGVLAALYYALRTVTWRAEARLWTALAIPVLVFMPNAGGSLLGMGFRIWHAAGLALLAVTLAARGAARTRTLVPMAGAAAGLAGLCRTEWGLAAVAAAALVLLARQSSTANAAKNVAALLVGFTLVFGAGLGFFVGAAGWQAVAGDGHVLLTDLPPETREFLVAFSGVRDWKSGLVQMAYSAAMWGGAILLVDLVARRISGRRALRRLLPVIAVLALTAALGGASGAVLFSAAPVVCAAALALSFRRRRTFRGSAAFGFAAAGLVLSYRRPFHIGDSGYVGPPLLFAFIAAAALLAGAVARTPLGRDRKRLGFALRTSLAVLVALSFAGRLLQYAADDRTAIPGTNGMLAARAPVARWLAELAAQAQAASRPGEGLVAFPEGEILNLLAHRSNPVRHKLYLPGYLTEANEPAVVAELAAARPAIVVVWNRPTGEYGKSTFGVDYGTRISRWIGENYTPLPMSPATARQARSYVRNSPGSGRGDSPR